MQRKCGEDLLGFGGFISSESQTCQEPRAMSIWPWLWSNKEIEMPSFLLFYLLLFKVYYLVIIYFSFMLS